MPAVSIIIPTKDREAILQESLQHLKDCVLSQSIEVIIVNDGSQLHLIDLPEYVRVVQNEGSGVASARNTGTRLASSDLLLFLDDDMWLTKEAIERIIYTHREQDNLALNVNWVYPSALSESLQLTCFGRYLERHQFTSLKGWNTGGTWDDIRPFQTNGITSQNLSIRKKVFLRIGGYNESFPHAGFEDYEFTKRLLSNGVTIVIDPTVMTYHNESDRTDLKSWLARKKKGAESRAVAVALGFKELSLNYGSGKKILFSLIHYVESILMSSVEIKMANRFAYLDKVTFKIIDLLFASTIYHGYLTSLKKVVTRKSFQPIS